MIASVGGKDKRRMTMCQPESTQQKQRRLRQGDVTILRALAALNMHHHAFRIEVANVQIQSFFQPQAWRIHRPEEIGRQFAEVSQLPHGSQVSFMSPLRHAAEMQVWLMRS